MLIDSDFYMTPFKKQNTHVYCMSERKVLVLSSSYYRASISILPPPYTIRAHVVDILNL